MNPSVTGVAAMAIIVAASNFLVRIQINDWLTWGALTYPVAFLVTDLINRRIGPDAARRVVYVGFACGVWRSRCTPRRCGSRSHRAPHSCSPSSPTCGSTIACAVSPPGGRCAAGLLDAGLQRWTPPCSSASPSRSPRVPWVTLAIGDYGVKGRGRLRDADPVPAADGRARSRTQGRKAARDLTIGAAIPARYPAARRGSRLGGARLEAREGSTSGVHPLPPPGRRCRVTRRDRATPGPRSPCRRRPAPD